MAIIDQRQVTFDSIALKQIVDFSPHTALTIGFPNNKPTNIVPNPSAHSAAFEFVGTAVTLQSDKLGALLISYCTRSGIKVPRNGQRSVRIEPANSHLHAGLAGLQVDRTMNIQGALPPADLLHGNLGIFRPLPPRARSPSSLRYPLPHTSDARCGWCRHPARGLWRSVAIASLPTTRSPASPQQASGRDAAGRAQPTTCIGWPWRERRCAVPCAADLLGQQAGVLRREAVSWPPSGRPDVMRIHLAGLCFTDAGAGGIPFHHELSLVALSYIVATGGSYAALEMIERWRKARGNPSYYWQLASAAALGGSIWSMHFALIANSVAIWEDPAMR